MPNWLNIGGAPSRPWTVLATSRSFDLILALDRGHVRELRRRCPEALRGRIQLLGALVGAPSGDVPDPYYQDLEAFEQVFDLLDGYCRRLLSQL